ncbi:MAG TPA: 2OG-Fe(II) oxygenase [Pyrinomonadaceae bacterium]|jgi:predicted 2-oxoglutarate/Fe(II)-dependent dioxygenase YbiX|nr:2OG-Fe(II) oxygenase [Pyrinomonadaceae bacterium]
MSEAVEAAHFNLFLLPNFLDPETCANLRAELAESPTTQAPVYIQGTEGTIHETVRKTTSMHPSQETFDQVHQRLLEQTSALSQHFGETLIDCEPPQFLHYEKGDFFVRHQDGNPRQDDFDHLRVRRISIVVFLNDFSAEPKTDCYSGGVLNFYDQSKEFGLQGKTGLLLAFTSDTFHEVMPVTSGERLTIITWFR